MSGVLKFFTLIFASLALVGCATMWSSGYDARYMGPAYHPSYSRYYYYRDHYYAPHPMRYYRDYDARYYYYHPGRYYRSMYYRDMYYRRYYYNRNPLNFINPFYYPAYRNYYYDDYYYYPRMYNRACYYRGYC